MKKKVQRENDKNEAMNRVEIKGRKLGIRWQNICKI